MKKISMLFIALSIILLSCTNKDEDKLQSEEGNEMENNFTVSGKVNGANNLTFYLEALSQQGNISVAETTSDASGNFSLTGNIPGFGLYQLRIGQGDEKVIPLTIVPNDKVEITADYDSFATKPSIKGAKWANTMTKYMKEFASFQKEQAELMQLRGTVSDEELGKRFLKIKSKIDQFSLTEMQKDPSNPFNIILSSAATPSMGFEGWNPKNLDVLKLVAEAYSKNYKDSPMANTMSSQVSQIETAYNNYTANSSGERTAPEIALKSPEGKEIRLSSLKGKYVLIDFWASWCAPCRQENPNVVRLYHKYKNKGFTVYSVSLDSDANAWTNAIAADGLAWPNHVSDLLQWKSPMPQLYGFNGIPHTVLINPEGKIIGTGLRGASLEQKLIELFEK